MRHKSAIVVLLLQFVVTSPLFSSPSSYSDEGAHRIDMSEVSPSYLGSGRHSNQDGEAMFRKAVRDHVRRSRGVRGIPFLGDLIKEQTSEFMNKNPEAAISITAEIVEEEQLKDNGKKPSSRIRHRRTVTCCQNSGKCVAIILGVIGAGAYVAAPVAQEFAKELAKEIF